MLPSDSEVLEILLLKLRLDKLFTGANEISLLVQKKA